MARLGIEHVESEIQSPSQIRQHISVPGQGSEIWLMNCRKRMLIFGRGFLQFQSYQKNDRRQFISDALSYLARSYDCNAGWSDYTFGMDLWGDDSSQIPMQKARFWIPEPSLLTCAIETQRRICRVMTAFPALLSWFRVHRPRHRSRGL